MADSLGNDIFLILVLSFSTCLVITRVLSSILFFFVIRISRLAIICIPCMHSCTLWSLLAEFFFLFFCIFTVGSKSSYLLALSILVSFNSSLYTFLPPRTPLSFFSFTFSIAFLFVCHVE